MYDTSRYEFIVKQPESANKAVIDFIADLRYNIGNGQKCSEDVYELFDRDYQYYFAIILREAFNRGEIRFIPNYNRILWYDTESNLHYSIDGVYNTCEPTLPLQEATHAGINYKRVPDYPNKASRVKPSSGKPIRHKISGFYAMNGDVHTWNKLLYKEILDVDATGELYAPGFKDLPTGTLQIDNSVKFISSRAFSNAYNLLNIILPDTLVGIERDAFSNCGLEEIYIPDTVEYIGVNALAGIPRVHYSGGASGNPWGAGTIIRETKGFERETYLRSQLGELYDCVPSAAINDCENKEDCDKLIQSLSRFMSK